MMSSAIPARLEFQCGHAALVSLPRIKGESSSQRSDRIAREKATAQSRDCDFCAPAIAQQNASEAVNGAAANGSTHAQAAQADVPEVVAMTAEPVKDNAAEAPPSAPRRRGRPPRVRLQPELSPAVEEAIAAASERLADSTPVPSASDRSLSASSSAAALSPAVGDSSAPRRRGRPRRVVAATTAQPTVPSAPHTNGAHAAPVRGQLSAKPMTVKAVTATRAKLARFTIHYRVETSLRAADIPDALRQLADRGAFDILSITSA